MSCTFPRTFQWLAAWTFSAAATARNSLATLALPSDSALSAHTVYFMKAWLSPAYASLRFSSVIFRIWTLSPRGI